MSKRDLITKNYMQSKDVFADAFNYLLYDGDPIIQADRLHECGTNLVAVPNEEGKGIERDRDLMMYMTAMEDDTATYLMLGIELQSEVHYGMPVRNMLYDAMQYERQMKEIAERHRRERKEGAGKKNQSSGEYLSGLNKEDKLIPVITLTMFFGAEEWDGPRRLHDMLATQKEEILEYVQDYRLNLITPAAMSEGEFGKLRTSLREVLEYIKYSKDREKLREVVEQNERYRNLEREAAAVINAVTRSKLKLEEEKEKIDMCKAIDDMRQECIEQGRAEARRDMCKAIDDMRQESLEQGLKQGRAEGRVEGRTEGLHEAIRVAISNGGTIELVARLFGKEQSFIEEVLAN